LNGQQKLEEFLQAVEDWKSSKYLVEVEPPEDAEKALNADFEVIKSWSAETCNMYAFKLYAYAEYIETAKAKEKNILEWAESSVWFIIGSTMNQYGGQYSKWQEKYYSAIKENPLASEILKIKNHAEARVRTLEGKNNIIIKMAEILTNMARRK
tara:strand:+ start:308 stop:769 length:462 start_codon:yes stop_codon:yes gene_type:complete